MSWIKLKTKNVPKVGQNNGNVELKKIILGLAIVTMLAGCNDGVDAFGIKLDTKPAVENMALPSSKVTDFSSVRRS